MTHERDARIVALRGQAAALRMDAKSRPHLRYELEAVIERLEDEANALEGAAAVAGEQAA